MPQNAHPDSTFSSHVHNDWTHVQLSDSINNQYPIYSSLIQTKNKEYPGRNTQKLAQGYEGMFEEDKRMFPEFEDQGDYV